MEKWREQEHFDEHLIHKQPKNLLLLDTGGQLGIECLKRGDSTRYEEAPLPFTVKFSLHNLRRKTCLCELIDFKFLNQHQQHLPKGVERRQRGDGCAMNCCVCCLCTSLGGHPGEDSDAPCPIYRYECITQNSD